ncbi:MAG TPA: tryptophan 7-halogenase [Polyangiaceae bacterium]|nr:tryptophan 7-halogenase [Polyangiaceae bacterium]
MLDLLVVGAGPAGSAAAIVARLAGLQVGLLDDANEQQLKVGESLPGATVRLLRRLGFAGPGDLLLPHEFEPCVANASAWGADDWTYRDALGNPEGGGWHVLRHRLDARLRDRAEALGATRIHARIGDACSLEGAWRISIPGSEGPHELDARFVIDATGRRAVFSRKQGVSRQRLSEQFAVVGWLRHPDSDRDRTTRVKSVANGWWYTARLPGELRVLAFHGLPRTITPLARQPAAFTEYCNRSGLLPYAVEARDLGEPLRVTDATVQCAERMSGTSWLAVGDAALSFDPLASQGILFALYSGIRGAETAIQCLASTQHAQRHLGEYGRKVYEVLVANQRARRLFYTSERRYLDAPYWKRQQRVTQIALTHGGN